MKIMVKFDVFRPNFIFVLNGKDPDLAKVTDPNMVDHSPIKKYN
jgi:hypothetical protein